MTNKEVANKFDVPKNTISTWIKNKEKIFQALEEITWLSIRKSRQGSVLMVCFTKEPEYTYRWVNGPRKRTFLWQKIGDPRL